MEDGWEMEVDGLVAGTAGRRRKSSGDGIVRIRLALAR